DPRTLSRLKGQVSRRAWAPIIVEFNDLPWVLEAFGQLATHDTHGVVLRTVVRNDEFKTRVRLKRQVVDGVCDPLGRVMRRHDHADQVHRSPPPPDRSTVAEYQLWLAPERRLAIAAR